VVHQPSLQRLQATMLRRNINPAARRARARAVFVENSQDELTHVCGCCCCGDNAGVEDAVDGAETESTLHKVGLSASQVAAAATRNIIPPGLTRFASEALPAQPDIEQLSDKVICVLAQNPGSFTLNGTNTYLVGTGKKRLLIDTGEGGVPLQNYLPVLRRAMSQYGIEGLDGIIVTVSKNES
jgi:hypothetical protein